MLTILQTKNFDQVYALLEDSFPIDEYRTYDEQLNLLNNSKYTIYAVFHKDSILAFAAVWDFSDFSFIEHFAVNLKYRSQGLGTFILQELNQLLSTQICLEVELPETAAAKRRIAFYERNGFFQNNYPYMQPSISTGRKPLPLILMTSRNRISPERFHAIKTTLYDEVYQTDISKINGSL